MNISVIGLGKLGSPLAAVLATAGHTVIGYDVNAEPVQSLREHIAPVDEPGLQKAIDDAGDRLTATTSIAEAVRRSSIIFIIVPTPSLPTGGFSCQHICVAATEIASYLPESPEYKLIVLVSTVMPGDTEGELIPLLESVADMKCGEDFGVCYNPEFIALGNVIHGIRQPDYLLIGSAHERDASILKTIYESVVPPQTPIRTMSIREAEITKLSQNVFITAKMSFANMLAEVCENCGADAQVIANAIGTDHRIGRAYLQPGPAFGGPCFPRDNRAFAAFLERYDTATSFPEATDLINRHQTTRLAGIARRYNPQCVGVLGLTYKTDTSVTEESAGMLLERELLRQGVEVIVHDPVAKPIAGKGTTWRAVSIEEVMDRADVVVITTPWPQYRTLSACKGAQDTVVIDCWAMFSDDESSHFKAYYRIGKGLPRHTVA